MKRDRNRLSGFYWVRFEGKVIVDEYTADGLGCSQEVPHWHVPLDEECFRDKEIGDLLSRRIPEGRPPLGVLRPEWVYKPPEWLYKRLTGARIRVWREVLDAVLLDSAMPTPQTAGAVILSLLGCLDDDESFELFRYLHAAKSPDAPSEPATPIVTTPETRK
jgi:hypothetical protein